MSALIEAMLQVVMAKQALHDTLRNFLVAGRLGGDWTIEPWEERTGPKLCALITPPVDSNDGVISVSVERLRAIQARIGCHQIYARANDKPGRITYLAIWEAQSIANDSHDIEMS